MLRRKSIADYSAEVDQSIQHEREKAMVAVHADSKEMLFGRRLKMDTREEEISMDRQVSHAVVTPRSNVSPAGGEIRTF